MQEENQQEHEESTGSGMARRQRKGLRFLISLCLSVTVFSTGILLVYVVPQATSSKGGDWLTMMGMHDHRRYYLPVASLLDTSIQSGELPLWNPLSFCGTPFAANPQSLVFYPPNLLRAALNVNPTPYNTQASMVIMMGLHLLFGGVGTLLLAREHKLSFGASLTAAFAFIFSAGLVRRACANMFVTTIVWMPFILLLLHKAFSADTLRRKLCYALGAGLLFGFSLLAGSPHMSLFMSITIVGYGVLYRILNLRFADFRWRGGLFRRIGGDALAGVLIFVVSALIAFAVLLPAAELAGVSDRVHQENLRPDKWVKLAPLVSLFTDYSGASKQSFDWRLSSLGVIVLALAAFGHPRKRTVLLYAAFFYIFVDCAMGPPLPFARLSLMIAPYRMAYLNRAMIWATFPLALLVGFGVDAVAARWQTRKPGALHSAFFGVVGLLALQQLWPAVTSHLFMNKPKAAVILPAAILVVVAFAGALPWLRRKDRHAQGATGGPTSRCYVAPIVTAVLFCLVTAELTAWGCHYAFYLTRWNGFKGKDAPLRQNYRMSTDNYRGADSIPNWGMTKLVPVFNGYDPLYIDRAHEVMIPSGKYLPVVKPRHTLPVTYRGNDLLKRSFWLAKYYVDGGLPDQDTLFPVTTTAFLSDAPEGLPIERIDRKSLSKRGVSGTLRRIELANEKALKRAAKRSKKDARIIELRLPRFELPSEYGTLCVGYQSSTQATVQTRFNNRLDKTISVKATKGKAGLIEIPFPTFSALRASLEVKLDRPAGTFKFTEAYVACDQEDEDDLITITRRRANSVELDVSNLPGDRILTFVDAHYPGWKAYVDGKPTPIYLAADAFKAVVVPAGTHTIRFEFKPWRVYIGVLVSVLTLLVSVLILLWEWRRSRRLGQREPAGEDCPRRGRRPDSPLETSAAEEEMRLRAFRRRDAMCWRRSSFSRNARLLGR